MALFCRTSLWRRGHLAGCLSSVRLFVPIGHLRNTAPGQLPPMPRPSSRGQASFWTPRAVFLFLREDNSPQQGLKRLCALARVLACLSYSCSDLPVPWTYPSSVATRHTFPSAHLPIFQNSVVTPQHTQEKLSSIMLVFYH